jgi:hypothetical protein
MHPPTFPGTPQNGGILIYDATGSPPFAPTNVRLAYAANFEP